MFTFGKVNSGMESFVEFFEGRVPEPYSKMGHFGEGIYYRTLEEGLKMSYPKDKVIKDMKADPSLFKYVRPDQESIVVITPPRIGDVEEVRDIINKKLVVYGYKVGNSRLDITDKSIMFVVEPIYPTKLTPEQKNEGEWYHITFERYLPKIRKIGLSPRQSSTYFTHPGGRVYIIQDLTEPTSYADVLGELPHMLHSAKGDHLMDQLNIVLQNGEKYDSLFKRIDVHRKDEVLALKINLPEGLDVYRDPMFPSMDKDDGFRAGFVMANIPPRYLEFIPDWYDYLDSKRRSGR